MQFPFWKIRKVDIYFFGEPYSLSEDKIVHLLGFIGWRSFPKFPTLLRLPEASSEAAYFA